MKVVVNSLLKHTTANAGVPQESLLGSILFQVNINDLLKNRSLVNVYAYDPKVYSCPSKNLDNLNLDVGLSFNLDMVAQWLKVWLITFNTSKIKLVTSHHHQANFELSPSMIDRCSLHLTPIMTQADPESQEETIYRIHH